MVIIRKTSFLVVIVISILIVLIVNAAEINESYNQNNYNSSHNATFLEENSINETLNLNNSNITVEKEDLMDSINDSNDTIGTLEVDINIIEQDAIVESGQNNDYNDNFTNITYDITEDKDSQIILNETLEINATEDLNDTLETDNITIDMLEEDYVNETVDDDSLTADNNLNKIESKEDGENKVKTVTASFGVYLQIVS